MSAAADVQAETPFDVTGELPVGTTVLEASAGTGKTYTIAGLVARYLAEGHAELDQLMIVTFGRMATDELRSRVRGRLVAVEAALTEALTTGVPADPITDDPIHALLTTGPGVELERRRERIQRALAEFDAATIATTHEFCSRMLDGLGVLGNAEPDAVFTEHLGDLTAEVARDVYLRRYAATGSSPFPFESADPSVETAQRVAGQVVGAALTPLVPAVPTEAPDPEPAWLRRVAYAEDVRAEVERRKRRSRLFSYDDMLTRLYDALRDRRTGAEAAKRLRDRYRIVLVDEFQDTDVVQWEILRQAFHGHRTLILIGDPKQAIYAFRGADVYSYLDARQVANRVQTLDTNWRSDRAVVDALDVLLGGVALGDERIVVRPVTAHHAERRLAGPAELTAPLRLRMVPPKPPDEDRERVGPLRDVIADDLVADVTLLLASRPTLTLDGSERTLGPSDIAVLVRKNSRGEAIRDALIAADVPAVLHGSGSVFAAEVATEWLTLLTALEQPRQFRQAALTCFVGWTIDELAAADDRRLTELAQRIRTWSRVLAARGVAALLELATAETALSERLLARTDGERVLTDLRHIGQALHATMTADRLGVSALLEWLRDQIARARLEAGSDLTRRLETDAEAVQVLTVHRSKGLQFPVVYLPEAWDAFTAEADDGRVLQVHTPPSAAEEGVGQRVLDVGGEFGPGREERWQQYRREDAGEDLRLLYVALTRAQCSVVTWWADSARNTTGSPLHRMLFRDGSGEPQPTYPVPRDAVSVLRGRGGWLVEEVTPRSPVDTGSVAGGDGKPGVRTFGRELDLEWRRTSYSSLTVAAHGIVAAAPSVGSEVEVAREDDEIADPPGVSPGLVPATPDPVAIDGLDRVSPMQDLPSGVVFGTAVHAVLEHVDPTVEDLPAELRRVVGGVLATGQPGDLSVEILADALLLAVQTPLGPLAGDRRLLDIAPADRLAELDFELPLAGGDVRGGRRRECRLGDLVPLLRDWLPADDPLHPYPELLAHPSLAGQSLRGYLTGSIDAVLRIGGADARYLVVDYKTNWLGSAEGSQLRLGDYTPDRMAAAMMAAHYPLQAILYAVAVHRMLRWRHPGYDPARQLGGVLYLFVRGMAGADTPRVAGVPCGVFSWRPAPELVVACSDLLDRGVR